MNLENFIIEFLENIKEAANKNENYDMHLENSYVKEIAEAYDLCKWIEIY